MSGNDHRARVEWGMQFARDQEAAPAALDQDRSSVNQSYLSFLRATDHPAERRRFPVLAFAFMVSMALVVGGLTASLAVERAGDLIPGGASAGDVNGGGARRSSNDVPLCRGLSERQAEQIDNAIARMRKTAEGTRLAHRLAKHDVCVGVEDLAFNSGYASAERSWTGSWDKSYIVVDKDLLSVAETDVIAALLIHEATHIDRFISGTACGAFDGCEVLANGVVLDEEIAAHAAEAEWWIDIYGSGGRRVKTTYGYSLDQLAAAYRRGDDAFRDFIREMRGDSREGAGI